MAEVIKGINIKLGLDGKDLESDLKQIKSELKEQEKDLKAINNNLKYDTQNISLWKDKQAKLNSILNDTKKKLANQNEQLENANKALKIGEISEKEYDKLRRSVIYSEAEVAKFNKELEKTKTQINDLANAKWEKLGSIGSTLTKAITLPLTGVISALSAISIKVGLTADGLKDTASKLGLNAEVLQEWNHISTITGVETTKLQKGFEKVNNILGKIALGNADNINETLAKIGLSINDLKDLNSAEVFDLLRNSISKLSSETEKLGIASQLFGEEVGISLIPILNESTESINSLKKECHDLGIITNEQAEIADVFTNTLERTKKSLTGLSMNIAVYVLPIFIRLLEIIQTRIIPVIDSWVSKWNSLSNGVKNTILVLLGLVASIGPVLSIISKVMPMIKSLRLGLNYIGASGIFAGVGLNFATLGIGALVVILGVALFKSESFKEMISKLMQTLMGFVNVLLSLCMVLVDSFKPIFDVVIDLITKITDLLTPLIDAILSPILGQLNILISIFEILIPFIRLISNIISTVLTPALNTLFIVLNPIFKLLENIINAIKYIFDNVGKVFSDIGDGINGFGSFLNNIVTNNKNINNKVSESTTTNHVTINTSAKEFDIDSINRALGGNYL